MRILLLLIFLFILINCEKDITGISENTFTEPQFKIDTLFSSWSQFCTVGTMREYLGNGLYKPLEGYVTCDRVFEDNSHIFHEYQFINFSTVLKTTDHPIIFGLGVFQPHLKNNNYAVYSDTVESYDCRETINSIRLDSIICLSGNIMPVDSIKFILTDIIRQDGSPIQNSNEFLFYELTVTGLYRWFCFLIKMYNGLRLSGSNKRPKNLSTTVKHAQSFASALNRSLYAFY